jgi:hypothetical protein
MLFNAHYLNEDALANYIAALEGGLRESGTARSTGSQGFGGSIGFGPTSVHGDTGTETESTLSLRDHNASRLQRLISAGHKDAERVGWIEVTQPDLEFAQAGTGAFIEWECDIYIPDAIATMTNGGFSNAVNTMKSMMPAAAALGIPMKETPDIKKMDAVVTFLDQVDIATVIIGDDSDTDWQIVGSLDKQWISTSASFDGRARIIGKVKKRVLADRWYPLMALPGMNLGGRDERRRMEREGPKDQGQESQFVRGPLLVLDFLAIFT